MRRGMSIPVIPIHHDNERTMMNGWWWMDDERMMYGNGPSSTTVTSTSCTPFYRIDSTQPIAGVAVRPLHSFSRSQWILLWLTIPTGVSIVLPWMHAGRPASDVGNVHIHQRFGGRSQFWISSRKFAPIKSSRSYDSICIILVLFDDNVICHLEDRSWIMIHDDGGKKLKVRVLYIVVLTVCSRYFYKIVVILWMNYIETSLT